jgi:multidrug resistance efflux pump
MSDAEREYKKALINYRIAKIRLKEIFPHKKSNEVALNNARDELLKTYELYKKGYVSLYELKTAEDKYENLLNGEKSRKYEYRRELISAEKKRKEALENLKKAELELEKAKERLKSRYVKSPIDGFLAKLLPLEGQEIFRNDVIGEIINLDQVKLKGAFFPGTYPFLHTGMVGEVKCFTVPAYIGNGTVEEIIPVIDPEIGRMVLYMTLDNKDFILQPKTKCIISFKFKPGEVGAMGLEFSEESKEIYVKSKIKSDELK